MFSKVIFFGKPAAVFDRATYYLAGEIESHKDLHKLDRWFMGRGIRGPFTFFHKAMEMRESRAGRPGAPTKYTYVEVIISTPASPALAVGEDRYLVSRLVDDLRSTAAMVGAHWHRGGRVDMHVLLLNETVEGLSLATNAQLLSTRRVYRNLEVVARQIVDRAHDELNVDRERQGRPRIPAMREVQGELARARRERETRQIDELVARSVECASLFGRAHRESSVTETPTLEAHPSALNASIASVEKSSSRSEESDSRRKLRWEELTTLLHRLMQSAAAELDEELAERRAKWFSPTYSLQLRREIKEGLERETASKPPDEMAVEAQLALRLCCSITADRNRSEKERGPTR